MLKVIPLGGLGEVGMNAMVLEHGGQRLLVDCGLMFPRGDQLGVEVVLPDFSWLFDAPEALTGVVLTHAHEDHLGALPWLLRELKVPVYGTRFTLALARHRLQEAGLEVELREVAPREPFPVGEQFTVEALRVTHSVPDAVGLSITTASGRVVHTGDFKLDGFPVDGQVTDLERLGELGDEGAALLLSDSTNAERPGWTGSEQLVRDTFARLIAQTRGRLIITLFGSHLFRVQHAVTLAREHGRRVLLLGRSLQRNVRLAQETGIFGQHADVLVDFDDAPRVPREQLIILCTGAQAEERSALQNLLNPEPGPLRLDAQDTVIFSSRTIPGNEPLVSELINRLLARGVKVITAGMEPGVHVSGHASQDEQQKMIDTVRPKHFVPIHGELRHLHRHLALAEALGVPRTLVTNGEILGLDADGARLVGRIPTGKVLMRRDGVAPVSPEALKERRWLAESGLVVAVTVLQLGSGKVLSGPTLQAHALQRDEVAVLPLATDAARRGVLELSEAMRGDDARVREEVLRAIRRVFKQTLGARPTILPLVIRL